MHNKRVNNRKQLPSVFHVSTPRASDQLGIPACETGGNNSHLAISQKCCEPSHVLNTFQRLTCFKEQNKCIAIVEKMTPKLNDH